MGLCYYIDINETGYRKINGDEYMIEYKLTKVDKLEKCYDTWENIIKKKLDDPNESISFHGGVVYNEEGYKYAIIEKGNEIWKKIDRMEPQLIGTGKIREIAMVLLAIEVQKGVIQNLVDYRDISYFIEKSSTKNCKDIEKALYLLYAKGDDKAAFSMLSQVLKKKYALISYFFFLKDSSKYQVVRPNNFAERFSLIGADSKYALECSWENYQKYMEVLKEVQVFLKEKKYDNVTLTDAHSFVWMLWMLTN